MRIPEAKGTFIQFPPVLKKCLDSNKVNYADERVLHFISELLTLAKTLMFVADEDAEVEIVSQYVNIVNLNKEILQVDDEASIELVKRGDMVLSDFGEALATANIYNCTIDIELVLDDRIIINVH